MADSAVAPSSGDDSSQPPAAAAAGRSWKQTLFQIIAFQLVMRFVFPKPQPKAPVDSSGHVIPPLINAFEPDMDYDVYAFITDNAAASLSDLTDTSPIWFLPSQQYTYNSKASDSVTSPPISFLPPADMYHTLTHQHLQVDPADFAVPESTGVLDLIKGGGAAAQRRKLAMEKTFSFLHLAIFAVPHIAYPIGEIPESLEEAVEILKRIDYSSEEAEIIASGQIPLVEYMKPVAGEHGLTSLLDDGGSDDDGELTPEEKEKREKDLPHWKDHLDVRMVVDFSPLTQQTLSLPHFRTIGILPHRGLYRPIINPSDIWLLERNYVALNETLAGQPLNLTLTFNSLSATWWMFRSQLGDVWNPPPATENSVPNPLAAFQSHSRRETFMLKRIVLDTNPYLLAFSACFMLLHTLFSMLAFKNDIQFWQSNKSMQGLSALSIIFSFACEVIIALYLYDSEETSFLILFEIFMSLAISAWKVTKAISIKIVWQSGSFPSIQFGDKQDYDESDTKKYDRVAIKFMSILLLPCMLGYSAYSLKYKKYKSWYSFIVSSLAGTVYMFGFIMMTPQLYINYKLKSVDHLPWRAFTYKALNTFVDDIAAFIIDMPWMHRLACFRDDLIFVCYLYQRWIYSVDKTRPTQWNAPPPPPVAAASETEALLADDDGTPKEAPKDAAPEDSVEKETTTDTATDETTVIPSKETDETTVRARVKNL